MQNSLNEERERIRNQIKMFFKENGITFNEDNTHIKVKGEIENVVILPYAEITIRVSETKFLTVEDREGKLILTYFKAFPEEIKKKLEISKTNLEYILQSIYYYNNKLVILF